MLQNWRYNVVFMGLLWLVLSCLMLLLLLRDVDEHGPFLGRVIMAGVLGAIGTAAIVLIWS